MNLFWNTVSVRSMMVDPLGMDGSSCCREVVNRVIIFHVTAHILTGGVPTGWNVFREEEHKIWQEEEIVDDIGDRVYEEDPPNVGDNRCIQKEERDISDDRNGTG